MNLPCLWLILLMITCPQIWKRQMNTKGCPTVRQIIHWAKWTCAVPFLLIFRFALISHQVGHRCTWGIVMELKDNWFCSGIHISDQIISRCTTRKLHQMFGRNQHAWRTLPRPTLPLQYSQMDFIGGPPAFGCSYCMVLICRSVGGLNAIQPDVLMPQQG